MILRCLALIGCGLASTTASAQIGQDFGALAATRTAIEVVADTGTATTGRLLRIDADSLTLARDHHEITFDRKHVAKIYQRGDSLKNGMLIGLGVGAAWGIAAGATAECDGFFGAPSRPCVASTKQILAGLWGGAMGALGLGVGAGIDALFSGRRLLYESVRHDDAASIFIAPRVLGSGTGLLVTVAW